MMRARSNTLNFEWRNWGADEEQICELCRDGIDTMMHFLVYAFFMIENSKLHTSL